MIGVADTCDSNPVVRLVSITSNEPDNGLGDGDKPNDIQGATFGSDDRKFELRSERSGTGLGRVYTITYSATDASGNTPCARRPSRCRTDDGRGDGGKNTPLPSPRRTGDLLFPHARHRAWSPDGADPHGQADADTREHDAAVPRDGEPQCRPSVPGTTAILGWNVETITGVKTSAHAVAAAKSRSNQMRTGIVRARHGSAPAGRQIRDM